MKRPLLSHLAALVIFLLASGPALPAMAQTPAASPVATADPFALPATHRILRIYAGNGFDFLRTDDGQLAYLSGDLVDDGLSTVPVPQWLEDWYTDMQVLDHYFTYAVMAPEDTVEPTGIIVDIRLLSFPDHDAAGAAVPASFDLLMRQAEEDPSASQGITMHPDVPPHDGAIIGVTGSDLIFNVMPGVQGEFVTAPFTRFIAQDGAMVASVKVISPDESFNEAVAQELLAAQLDCLAVKGACAPVPLPAGIPFAPATPVASPVAVMPPARPGQE
jgi:hypothetical protein